MTHTQGPWETHRIKHRDDNAYAAIYAPAKDGGNVRVASTCDSASEWEANARLIAAAPDLLAALQGALVLLERLAPDTDRKLIGGSECSIGHYASYHVETARAAIAKATNA